MSVKVIYHNMGNIREPNDLSYPYRLVAELSVGGMLMEFAAASLYGSERCTIIGHTEQELREVADQYGISRNPRLRSMVIERNT